MMLKGRSAKRSKRIKNVTRVPDWALRMKGKNDSRKGKGVCDEFIRQLNKKLIAMESNEVIDAETTLFEPRKEAAVILASLAEQKKVLTETSDNQKTGNAQSIRENRRDAKRRGAAKDSLKDALERLIVINERIINTDTVLDERINKMRSKAAEKIHVYVVGIRSGELNEYEWDMTCMDDSAREIYKAKHKELDERIRAAIALKMKEEVAA